MSVWNKGIEEINRGTGRLINDGEVIKAVDRHTNNNDTLDNDISCILEDVSTVATSVDEVEEALEIVKRLKEEYEFFSKSDLTADGNVAQILGLILIGETEA